MFSGTSTDVCSVGDGPERQCPLALPLATFAVASCYGRNTSTPAIRSQVANAASRLRNRITEPAPAPTMAALASMVSLIRWAFHPDHAVCPGRVPEARPDLRLSALCGGRGLDIGRRVTRLGGSATAERHAPETPERQPSRASSSQGRLRTARRQAEKRAAGRLDVDRRRAGGSPAASSGLPGTLSSCRFGFSRPPSGGSRMKVSRRGELEWPPAFR